MSNDDGAIDRDVRPIDLKAIMYTSGTSGRSKGVTVAHAHAFEYANGCASAIELGEHDVYYTAGLPLFHIAGKWGVLLAAAIKGATAVVPRQFSASRFWNDVRKHRVTAAYFLGAMANFLQRQPESPGDADNPLQKILMCPLLPDLDAFTRRFGVKVATAYGSTEVNAPIALPLGTPVRHNQVVGTVRSDLFEVRIVDTPTRSCRPASPARSRCVQKCRASPCSVIGSSRRRRLRCGAIFGFTAAMRASGTPRACSTLPTA